ncbi:MAG: carboxypeptidase-like regulatory domain-containing protein [Chlamydiota bacterium]|nr:carboxypeptidase-like regulatory domain-containing protein [Chlamydiota bacterium]
MAQKAFQHVFLTGQGEASLSPNGDAGGSARLSIGPGFEKIPFNWSLSTQYMSRYYASPSQNQQSNQNQWQINGSVGGSLWKRLTASVGGQYGIGNGKDSWGLNATLGGSLSLPNNQSGKRPWQKWGRNCLRLGVVGGYRQLLDGQRVWDVVVSASPRSIWGLSSSTNYNARLKQLSTNVGFAQDAKHALEKEWKGGILRGEGGVSIAGSRVEGVGRASYEGAVGKVSCSHNLYENSPLPGRSIVQKIKGIPSKIKAVPSYLSGQTQITASTALVYAGGSWSLASPVNGSFAIIVPKPFLRPYPIEVYRGGAGGSRPQGRASWWSPGVISGMPSYEVSRFSINGSEEMPLGADLGESSYALYPLSRSGYRVVVGGKGIFCFVQGKLVNQEGRPIAGKHLTFVGAEGEVTEGYIFTGQSGQFFCPEVLPGRYEVKIQDVRHEPFFIEVKEPKDIGDTIRLGTLIVNTINPRDHVAKARS